MKEAFWGVGLIMLAIFGIFLISLFGNITVTNNQDYTWMKNTVEASMYDAVDMARYRRGFCLCTDLSKNSSGKWVFTKRDDYILADINTAESCPTDTGKKHCELLYGEYKIDQKTFAEILVRRFAESVKGNSSYQIIINDVIEYPPKVSVTIKSSNSSELDGSDYTIVNEIDSLIEVNASKDKG